MNNLALINKPNPRAKIFDWIFNIFEQHVAAESHYLVACALWALHTHVYRKFGVTPRLALLSPVENCGKSTVLGILQGIVREPEYLIDPTPASLFRMANESTLLLDEADNLSIDRTMRAILNAGHKAGGTVPRVMLGEVVQWPVFAPIALAAIGTLPITLMSRSIVIQMHRADPSVKFVRFDEKDADLAKELAFTKLLISWWASEVPLNPDPSIPAGLGRVADNWRVLLAIADSLGRGEIARDAAIKIMGEYQSPNFKILLLCDIRTVFDEMKTRIVPSQVLVEKLLTLDGEYDWFGHQLTQGKLARVLNEFQIKSQKLWWPEQEHRNRQQCLKGYARADFEPMWRRYATSTTNATGTTTR